MSPLILTNMFPQQDEYFLSPRAKDLSSSIITTALYLKMSASRNELKPGMGLHACNLCVQEAEAKGSEDQDQTELYEK